jgi:hypothetical protein
MKVYTGDLLPDLTITCLDGDTGVDLTTADDVLVVAAQNGVQLFNRSVVGGVDGVVTVPWQSGDTDTAGSIFVEVRVIWSGGKPQTFRPVEVIEVVESL